MPIFFFSPSNAAQVREIAAQVERRLEQPVAVLPIDQLRTCGTCMGSRMVLTPAWVKYYREFPEKRMEPEQPEDFFLDHGYINIDQWGEGLLPQKHQPCPDCTHRRPVAHG